VGIRYNVNNNNNQHLFNGYFPGKPRVSQYQNVTIVDFIGAWMMEMVVTTGAVRRAKLESNHSSQSDAV